MEPTRSPQITHLLAREMWVNSQTPKPTALGTPLRYSSSYGCSRQQGYAAFDAEPTEPMDEAGAWVTGVGTIIHEALQASIARLFPDAEFEVPSGTEYVSGSCDALIPARYFDSTVEARSTHVLWELKTMGTYSFDKQVGWNRLRGEYKYPEGPARKAITQAGMNALGIEASREGVRIEWVVTGSITFEALSKNKAENMGIEGYNRFLAEFWVPRSEWEPMALDELKRIESMHEGLSRGYLPDRVARDDNGHLVFLNPNDGKNWQCDYCPYRTLCQQDGANEVWINDSELTRKEKEMADATERR
jgi:hypothetical protein